MGKRNHSRLKKSPAIKAAFLMRYEETGRIDLACKHAGIGTRTHYGWLERDQTYKKHFEFSKKCMVQLLEDEALRRAVEGVERAVVVAGQREVVREYSDTLLIFLLKGAMPDKYRERYQTDISGTVKHDVEIGLAEAIIASRQKREAREALEAQAKALPPASNGREGSHD